MRLVFWVIKREPPRKPSLNAKTNYALWIVNYELYFPPSPIAATFLTFLSKLAERNIYSLFFILYYLSQLANVVPS